MTSTVVTVARKEWRDSLRDRRSLTSAALFAIAGPILIALMITATAENEDTTEPITVQVSGAGHATDLTDFLRRSRVDLVESGESAAVSLSIPGDYGERFSRGRTVTVQVAADRSKTGARREAERLERLLHEYSASLGQVRLALRGVASSVGRPVVVESRDLATREARASEILSLLTIYFLMAAFIGSMAVSIDAAAGERERNSLEVLMAQPISSSAVFLGKTVVASGFGTIGISLAIATSKLVFLKVPLSKIGLTWTLGWADAGRMAISLVPLAILVAALQIALSLWARTFKEASAYLNVLMLLPMGVSLVVLVKEIEGAAWMYWVPLLGHQQLLRSMVRAESVDPTLVAVLAATTLVLAALLVWAGGRMLLHERIVFGQTG